MKTQQLFNVFVSMFSAFAAIDVFRKATKGQKNRPIHFWWWSGSISESRIMLMLSQGRLLRSVVIQIIIHLESKTNNNNNNNKYHYSLIWQTPMLQMIQIPVFLIWLSLIQKNVNIVKTFNEKREPCSALQVFPCKWVNITPSTINVSSFV